MQVALSAVAPNPSESPLLRLALPAGISRAQDAEWCVIDAGNGWREVRFHDYAAIYRVPGLYEMLFHEHLNCASPAVVADDLIDALDAHDIGDLRVLDVGAGNGIVAEELATRGVEHIVGVDILPEAKMAAQRDRPRLYSAYHVADLTSPTGNVIDELGSGRFNAMTCVAALGFGDIPTSAFARAFAFVEVGGLVAFNIKEDFLNVLDSTGFGHLIRELVEKQIIKVVSQRRYRHRLGIDGEALYYIAVVAEKRAQAPKTALDAS